MDSWWWNLVLLVEADGERLILRRYGVTPPEEVRWELALLDHLLAHGFPTIAPQRRADGGKLSAFGGKPAILYPYVEGHNGCRGVDRLHAMTQTAALVARMHDLTRDLVLPHPRVQSGSDSRRTLDQLLRFVEQRGIAADEDELRELVGDAERQLEAFAGRLAPYEDALPRGIVHHDAHCNNVLFREGRLVALIDFDDACPGYLVSDLAVMVYNWTGDSRTGGLVEARARQLIRTYERHRRLTAPERELLPDLVLLFTLSDTAADVQSKLEQGVPAKVAIAECRSYPWFRHRAADPRWRTALDSA
jgi:homoserine kinase type II